MKNTPIAFLLSALSLLSLAPVTMAAQTGDAVIYNFKGTFKLSTPCVISDDKEINVPFGNVAVNKVDGVNYLKPIPYTVDCQGAKDDSPLTLTVTGTPVLFDEAAVTTSAEGLGIQIQANGQPMKLNQPMNTTLGALASLTLNAVPVKDPAKTLTEQVFTATATLKAEYQ